MGEQGCFSKKRALKSTLHPAIFWEMVKFVDLGVLYFSLVLPRQATWLARGPEWILRTLGGTHVGEMTWSAYLDSVPKSCDLSSRCQHHGKNSTYRTWYVTEGDGT